MAPARLPAPTEGPEACRVWAFKTLGRRDDGRAREMLEKTAWQVQPIMRKRGWKVKELTEMKPEQRDRVGDNLNAGQRVRLKLRTLEGGWYDYEHVVLVMLHELVHNEIGPHNKAFFKLLDEITVECEELMAKGVGGTGAGFDAKGTKLGHRGGWGGLTPADARRAAANAAAERAKAHAIMPAGGRTLGGSRSERVGPAAAAAAAAERRLRAESFAKQWGLMDDVVIVDEEEEEETNGATGGAKGVDPADGNAAGVSGGGAVGAGDEGEGGAGRAGWVLSRFGRVSCPCCAAALRTETPAAAEMHVRRCEGRREKEKTSEGGATGDGDARGSCDAAAVGCGGEDDDVIVLLSPSPPPVPRRREDAAGKGPERAAEEGAETQRGEKRRRGRVRPESANVEGDADDDVIIIEEDDDDARVRRRTNDGVGGGGGVWRCKMCTLANPESDSHCSACDTWRFSRGAPACSRPTFERKM